MLIDSKDVAPCDRAVCVKPDNKPQCLLPHAGIGKNSALPVCGNSPGANACYTLPAEAFRKSQFSQRREAELLRIVCLWPGGSSAITNHSAWINKACALRKEVIILDIPLDGVFLPHPISGQDLHIGWSTLYILNASLIKMDDSLFALRMRAILQFFMDYKNREPNRKLTLYSASTHIAYAKFAALLFGICLQTEGDCPAWEEIWRSNPCCLNGHSI